VALTVSTGNSPSKVEDVNLIYDYMVVENIYPPITSAQIYDSNNILVSVNVDVPFSKFTPTSLVSESSSIPIRPSTPVSFKSVERKVGVWNDDEEFLKGVLNEANVVDVAERRIGHS